MMLKQTAVFDTVRHRACENVAWQLSVLRLVYGQVPLLPRHLERVLQS
jgi:hypothetical protein